MWLESDDIRLQLVRPQDKDELKIAQEQLPEWYNLSEKEVYSGDMPERMTFGILHAGKTVGAAELLNIRWFNHKSEIRFWLLPEVRGKGLAKAALELLMDLAFNTLNFHRLEAEVYAYNPKAQKLVEKLGFRLEGVLREAKYYKGKYHDIIRYGILRQEFLNSHPIKG